MKIVDDGTPVPQGDPSKDLPPTGRGNQPPPEPRQEREEQEDREQ